MARVPTPTQLEDEELLARAQPGVEYMEARANFIAVENRCRAEWQAARDLLDAAKKKLLLADGVIPKSSETAVEIEVAPASTMPKVGPPQKVQKDLKAIQVAKALIKEPGCSVHRLAKLIYPSVELGKARSRIYSQLHFLRTQQILIATGDGEVIDIPRLQEVWPQTPRSS